MLFCIFSMLGVRPSTVNDTDTAFPSQLYPLIPHAGILSSRPFHRPYVSVTSGGDNLIPTSYVPLITPHTFVAPSLHVPLPTAHMSFSPNLTPLEREFDLLSKPVESPLSLSHFLQLSSLLRPLPIADPSPPTLSFNQFSTKLQHWTANEQHPSLFLTLHPLNNRFLHCSHLDFEFHRT